MDLQIKSQQEEQEAAGWSSKALTLCDQNTSPSQLLSVPVWSNPNRKHQKRQQSLRQTEQKTLKISATQLSPGKRSGAPAERLQWEKTACVHRETAWQKNQPAGSDSSTHTTLSLSVCLCLSASVSITLRVHQTAVDTDTHRLAQIFLLGLYIDFHSFVQPNPNPFPTPDLNQFMP